MVLSPCIRASLRKTQDTKEKITLLSKNTEKSIVCRWGTVCWDQSRLHKRGSRTPKATEYVNTQLDKRFRSFLKHTLQHKHSQGPDLRANGQTHIREVPCHPTALAVLVPQRGPFTGPEAMWRQSTAWTGVARTVPLDVALDPTKDTGGTFLLTETKRFF